jgi:hypothetical protein
LLVDLLQFQVLFAVTSILVERHVVVVGVDSCWALEALVTLQILNRVQVYYVDAVATSSKTVLLLDPLIEVAVDGPAYRLATLVLRRDGRQEGRRIPAIGFCVLLTDSIPCLLLGE